jgi:hypothetical protein
VFRVTAGKVNGCHLAVVIRVAGVVADFEEVQAERLHLGQHAVQCRLVQDPGEGGVRTRAHSRPFELAFRAALPRPNTTIFGEPNGEPTVADIQLRRATTSRVRAVHGLTEPHPATRRDVKRDWGSRGRGFKSRRPD